MSEGGSQRVRERVRLREEKNGTLVTHDQRSDWKGSINKTKESGNVESHSCFGKLHLVLWQLNT